MSMKIRMLFLMVFLLSLLEGWCQNIVSGNRTCDNLEEKHVRVDCSTGIFHYRLPLFSIGDGTVRLPFSLDYASHGVKEEDKPGLVGYNWTLNLGGVITRTVRGGMADEEPSCGYLGLGNRNLKPLEEDVADVNKRKRDGESDIFTAVFGNRTVHFIILEDGKGGISVEPLECTSVKIEADFSHSGGIASWILTDEYGNRYLYGASEYASGILVEEGVSYTRVRGHRFATAWYLRRIEPYNGTPIEYFYKDRNAFGMLEQSCGCTYMVRYHYGRPMSEHTFDFSPYQLEFEKNIAEACRLLSNSLIEKQLKSKLYKYIGQGRWAENPFYALEQQQIASNFRVLGQLSDFSGVMNPSLELLDELNRLYSLYITDKNLNARMAADCFAAARDLVVESLKEEREVTEEEVRSGISYRTETPLPDSIVCGRVVVRFLYTDKFLRRLRGMEYGDRYGRIFSGVEIKGADYPSAVVFTDSRGVETGRLSFEYWKFDWGDKKVKYDLWGYPRDDFFGNVSYDSYYDIIDSVRVKTGTLRSIVFPDGGRVVLDYEPNRTEDRPWGGIRLKSLVSEAGGSSVSDTIQYSYPLGGNPVCQEVYHSESVYYTYYDDFWDIVEYGRMKMRGVSCLPLGNNGLFYPYVQEKRFSSGMRAYWFATDNGNESFISHTLNGLSLAAADYDSSGRLVRLVKNHYRCNVPSGGFSGFFSTDIAGLPAVSLNPQVRTYEYYMDAAAVYAHYESQPPLYVDENGMRVCVFAPVKLYDANIAPRTHVRVPFNSVYRLLTGELFLLTSREEYRFSVSDTVGVSYNDAWKGSPSELYRREDYHYDDLPHLFEPSCTVIEDSRGNRQMVRIRRIGGMGLTDSVYCVMQTSHVPAAVVKRELFRDSLLLEQTITEYGLSFLAGRSIGLPARTYSYRPASGKNFSPESCSDSVLFDFGRENYVLRTETEYGTVKCRVLPVTESDRSLRMSRSYRPHDGRVLLEAGHVGKEEMIAVDLKERYVGRNVSEDGMYMYYSNLEGLHSLRDFLPEFICRDISFADFPSRTHFRLLLRFLDKMVGPEAGSLDTLRLLADSLMGDDGRHLSWLETDFGNLSQAGNTVTERMFFNDLVSCVFQVLYDNWLDSLDFQHALSDWRQECLDTGQSRLTHLPSSGRLKLYLLSEGSCNYFPCRMDFPDGIRLEEIYNSIPGIPEIGEEPVKDDRWQLQIVDVELSRYPGLCSISIDNNAFPYNLVYAALIPDGTEFRAVCYNADGSEHASFDQTGQLRINGYDAAGRLTDIWDGNGSRLTSYIYHRAGDTLPSSEMTYSNEYSYQAERLYQADSRKDSSDFICNVTYLDGFGRPWQKLGIEGGGDGRSDLVQVYAYGPGNRVEREYLPYASISRGGLAVASPYASFHWADYGAVDSAYAFTHRIYESSPLGRELKCVGPGYAWHSRDRGTETEYGFNADSCVRMYYADASGNLVNGGYYKAGTLDCVRVTDKDGRVVEVYTDRDGREVLSVSLSLDDTLETYRVYDDYGRLSWVLPPEASARLGGSTDAEVLERYAFHYVYDHLDRLVEKKLPGCAPVYMVYDGKDRPVLVQDGEQRKTDNWSYTLYDDKNRVTESGEVALPGVSLVELRREAGRDSDYVPLGELKSLQCFEYDNYTDSSHVFVSVPGYASGYYSHVCGKLTGVRKRSLSNGGWYRATCYYDERGREIQRSYDNALGGVSRIDRCYDFVDNVVREREIHGMPDGRLDVLENSYTYDKRSRLLERSVSLNGGKPVVIRNGYDKLGREISRQYGDCLVSRTYNIRGWQTGISCGDFHERLYYESGTGERPGRYNGSISGVEWRNGSSTASLYLPKYDGFDRLRGVEEYRQTASGWEKNSEGYEERGITYDRNGNIRSLQRTAGGKVVDDLEYTYSGNFLSGLSEKERAEVAGDVYAPGAAEAGTYAYDLNGNLVKDSRRRLEYGYNSLNLLEEVSMDGQPAVKYDWLADGTKLGVKDVEGKNGFVYVGSLIYRAAGKTLKLETAYFGDGVICQNDNGTQDVNYFICDHLGSVRMIVDSAGTVKERNDYYPFGARQKRDNYPQLSANRWKYNGKELQTMGDLGFLDYGARMYDMSVGRWFGMDPLAERYAGLSGYVFSGNNPLILVDENGGFFTHYVDKDYNVLFQTDDGSDDVVMVPDAYVGDFRKYSDFSSGLDYIFNSLGWNRYWKDKFGLADRQFNERELMFLDGFNTGWSRDNAAEYLLKPTAGGLISMSFSEALSQWTNPELVVAGLSICLGVWQETAKLVKVDYFKTLKPLGLGSTGRNVAKNLQEQLAMEEIMSHPSSGIILIKHINDSRWNGWSKMSNKKAHGIEIHYTALWKNNKIVAIDDFKFVD